MKYIIRAFEVFIMTFIVGIIYSIIIYLIETPSIPNMFEEGTLFFLSLYSLLNVLFMLIIYVTTYLTYKRLCEKIFILKYIFVEIVLLYVLYEVALNIHYNINILPISKYTEGDLFNILAPFLISYLVWWIFMIVSVIRNNNKGNVSN